MNVLIIEPDGILAKVYQKAMLNTGKNAYIAQTAQKAISMIDELKPSVIILELQLSGHSGIEFLHEFRSYEDWTNIRVIIHSSVPKTSLNLNSRIWKQLGIDKYLYNLELIKINFNAYLENREYITILYKIIFHISSVIIYFDMFNDEIITYFDYFQKLFIDLWNNTFIYKIDNNNFEDEDYSLINNNVNDFFESLLFQISLLNIHIEDDKENINSYFKNLYEKYKK